MIMIIMENIMNDNMDSIIFKVIVIVIIIIIIMVMV